VVDAELGWELTKFNFNLPFKYFVPSKHLIVSIKSNDQVRYKDIFEGNKEVDEAEATSMFGTLRVLPVLSVLQK